jgi:hypothetical protein
VREGLKVEGFQVIRLTEAAFVLDRINTINRIAGAGVEVAACANCGAWSEYVVEVD